MHTQIYTHTHARAHTGVDSLLTLCPPAQQCQHSAVVLSKDGRPRQLALIKGVRRQQPPSFGGVRLDERADCTRWPTLASTILDRAECRSLPLLASNPWQRLSSAFCDCIGCIGYFYSQSSRGLLATSLTTSLMSSRKKPENKITCYYQRHPCVDQEVN